ncbi:FxLYD domain-containing protein (plasmid) [Burkholderia vietnamiensis]|nr:FxLYD domain-containing protein [Burkholderia vietnamiensis]
MRRRLASVLAAVTVLLSAPAFAADSPLALSDDLHTVPSQSQYGALAGTAVNTSDKVIPVAVIQFDLLDENDRLVGNTLAEAFQLAPGQQWIYNAIVLVPFHHARVKKVTAM